MTTTLTLQDIRAAADRLRGVAVRTLLLEVPLLNESLGGRLLIKPECLQRTGSFKFRGAYNRLAQLSEVEKKAGVVAFSSGNHAQGVAHAAQLLGIPATIVMPQDSPAIKMANTKAYGAQVIAYDRQTESREAIADQIAAEQGLTVVPSFNDLDIMAGQGTVGLEIADDLLAADMAPDQVLICCGGGGLSSGSFLALRDAYPTADLYTVEPVAFDDTLRSLESGQRQHIAPGQQSICDALLSEAPGPLPLEVLLSVGAKGLTVTDEEALSAMVVALTRLKVVAEPGGAVALAAALSGKVPLKDRTTVAVITGGNADPAMIDRALAVGEDAGG